MGYSKYEGKVKLEAAGGKNFAYWKPYLTDMLIEAVKADNGILIHLATEEFEHLFDWKRVCQEVKVIQPLLYVDKGDTIKVVSIHAKSCRRAMTKYIIQHQITQPEDILGFELDVFMYILLMAHGLGLGTVWTALYPAKDRYQGMQQLLKLPKHVIPLNTIVIGYPKVEVTSKDKWKKENVSYNDYIR